MNEDNVTWNWPYDMVIYDVCQNIKEVKLLLSLFELTYCDVVIANKIIFIVSTYLHVYLNTIISRVATVTISLWLLSDSA